MGPSVTNEYSMHREAHMECASWAKPEGAKERFDCAGPKPQDCLHSAGQLLAAHPGHVIVRHVCYMSCLQGLSAHEEGLIMGVAEPEVDWRVALAACT